MATYQGNRNNYPLSLTIVDDAAPPNATNFNTPIEGLADQAAWIQARLLASAAQNWQALFNVPGSTIGPQVAGWNDSTSGPSQQCWLFACRHPSGPALRIMYANGQDQQLLQLASDVPTIRNVPPASICVGSSALNGEVFVGTAGAISVNDVEGWACPSGGSFSNFFSATVTACTDSQLVTLAPNIVILAAGSSSAGQATMGQINPGAHLSAVSGVTTAAWVLKTNGSYACAIAKVAGAATVYKTSDGITYTTASLAGVIGVTDVPIDLSWSATLSQWLLAVSVAGGATTKFFTSVDGQAFTATGTTLSSAATVTSLAALGAMWAAAIQIDATDGAVIFTFDGITFYRTGGQVTENIGVVPRIVSGPTQFALFGASPPADTTSQNPIRFSHCVGLPTQVVT